MNMQTFRKWLFSSKPSQKYQHCLVNLTQLSRQQLMEATGTLTWDIWNADTLTAAA